MTVSELAAVRSEFRCAACGYGISVSGALPTCPMCQRSSWKRTELSEGSYSEVRISGIQASRTHGPFGLRRAASP
jgi:hypothetical protein